MRDASSAGEAFPRALSGGRALISAVIPTIEGDCHVVTQNFQDRRGCRRPDCALAQRARERRILSELDEHMLRDIGLTRSEAHVEVGAPVLAAATIARSILEARARRLRGSLHRALSRVGREGAQPRFVAFSENDSASRGWPSGRRNSPRLSAGTIIGNRR